MVRTLEVLVRVRSSPLEETSLHPHQGSSHHCHSENLDVEELSLSQVKSILTKFEIPTCGITIGFHGISKFKSLILMTK